MIKARNTLYYIVLLSITGIYYTGFSQKIPGAAISGNLPLVGFVSRVPVTHADPETASAFAQLASLDFVKATSISENDLKKMLKRKPRYDLLWFHCSDTAANLFYNNIDQDIINSLKAYVEQGGKLLLTNQAARLVNLLGFESKPLQDSLKVCKDNGYGRRLGLHAFRDHPVFAGLNGGAYLLRPPADFNVIITGFFGNNIPQEGKVVAVDWDYIFLREDTKILMEYDPGKGKVLAVGGYVNFSAANTNRAHLNMFAGNCLRYLLGQSQGQPGYYWRYEPGSISECPALPESDRLVRAVPPASRWDLETNELDLTRRYATGNFWDVAGERILTMGSENGGIDEIWAHPFMALKDYKVAIRFANQDSVFSLPDDPEITVTPSCLIRQYKFPRAYLKEVIVNDPLEPGGVIHYEYRGVYPAELIICFNSNLRWMWPYSERVTGSLCHAWNSDLNALMIRDHSGDLNVMVGGNKIPVQHFSGQFKGFRYRPSALAATGIPTEEFNVSGFLSYKLEMNDNLDIVYTASADGFDKTLVQFDSSLRDPFRIYRNSLQHAAGILATHLMITTPDRNFNTGYRWAVLATDRFFVNTPGMGKALTAGYSTTKHGWDGNHKVNGRPGYGWYFGRDAEWSSFALLDYGDFEKVKFQLEFFNKYQDLNGKIFHEASTSGFLHYDAADATPLYVVLAGKYFKHTNDTTFLRMTWPNIRKAINFCFSTDTDQDHLIENTNVGHGWVEGGKLYGSHSTLYMTGSWGAALREAANMAVSMNDAEAGRYRLESEMQYKLINSDFWSEESRFFSYGKNLDGSFRQQQTILPTVPMYFRMTDPDKANIALRSIAGNAFTTNWGARILREDSPMFKPAGYHYGSVWPLFTGWASLAEYATGNPLPGFSHMMNNLNIYRNFGLGFVEEVMNGAAYTPSGVCAHQCWSETMVLQPAIEGMLGLEVKAQEHKIILAPQFPPQWDSLSATMIRIADQRVNLKFKRQDGTSEFSFLLDHGKPVRIDFMPAFPPGTAVDAVSVNGQTVPFTVFKTAQSMNLYVSFDLAPEITLTIRHHGGIAVLPLVADPRENDPAEGMRILTTRLNNNRYEVEVEGLAGTSGILEFWSEDLQPEKAENARFAGMHGKIVKFAVDFERSAEKYRTKTVIVDL